METAGISWDRGKWEGSTSVAHQCRLAKFHDLTYEGKYSAVIGLEEPSLENHAGHMTKSRFSTNYSAVFPPVRNFTNRRGQGLTLPRKGAAQDPCSQGLEPSEVLQLFQVSVHPFIPHTERI